MFVNQVEIKSYFIKKIVKTKKKKPIQNLIKI
jgi:hypothetical protein